MGIKSPPFQDQTLMDTNRFSATWVRWLDAVYRTLSGKSPLPIASYNVASLPPISTAEIIFVSDESGGAVLAFSDGTNWRRVTDRAIVT